ncbi:hypothetical protein MNEG_12743, partial [Monoraphidium neglectum]
EVRAIVNSGEVHAASWAAATAVAFDGRVGAARRDMRVLTQQVERRDAAARDEAAYRTPVGAVSAAAAAAGPASAVGPTRRRRPLPHVVGGAAPYSTWGRLGGSGDAAWPPAAARGCSSCAFTPSRDHEAARTGGGREGGRALKSSGGAQGGDGGGGRAWQPPAAAAAAQAARVHSIQAPPRPLWRQEGLPQGFGSGLGGSLALGGSARQLTTAAVAAPMSGQPLPSNTRATPAAAASRLASVQHMRQCAGAWAGGAPSWGPSVARVLHLARRVR